MKVQNVLLRLLPAVFFLLPLSVRADMQEIAFAIQGNQLTWFEVANPTLQGNIAVTGLSPSLNGNGLAYDPVFNRLLFVNSDAAQNHTLFSVSLNGFTYQPGVTINAGAVGTAGTIQFQTTTPELFGADFYNGSYYTLRNGTDSLVKVNFNGSGAISSFTEPNLPGTPTPFLGDEAFKLTSGATDFFISGDNQSGTPSAANSRLWHYTTSDGVTFTAAAGNPIQPNTIRMNGMFFSLDGTLYGYQLGNGDYGTIDQTTGAFTTTYAGAPFTGGGDLAPGFIANVVPEPSSVVFAGMGLLLLAGLRRRFYSA
jgi:hypothetical protein